ncbi:MAG: hypothetical protein V2A54_13010 [Bacteroidota bacterium]
MHIIRTNKNGINRQSQFPKQDENPNNIKNIPQYIGFRVRQKGPSLIMPEDFSMNKVVLCFLKRERVIPISANPTIAIKTPPKLYGNGMKLKSGNRK